MEIDPLLTILEENAKIPAATAAEMLGETVAEVEARIKKYEQEKIILAYKTIIDDDRVQRDLVKAVIEVKVTPERGGGFNRLASRIAKYPEVESCYLMSGTYDLLVFVEARNLREVSSFISEKLATLEGVLSTATHFQLKTYKQQGVLSDADVTEERLRVSP